MLVNTNSRCIFAPAIRDNKTSWIVEIGRLAQLVQSTSFTPRGSGVRTPHRPQNFRKLQSHLILEFFLSKNYVSIMSNMDTLMLFNCLSFLMSKDWFEKTITVLQKIPFPTSRDIEHHLIFSNILVLSWLFNFLFWGVFVIKKGKSKDLV